MAYIFSYYAIALAWIISLLNYALVGALSTPSASRLLMR